tara:strand:+ start:384 stop:644 length:261 start_codon:yes stop_codon:yes gene_type:complete
MIIIAKEKHSIVFVLNIDSPRINQVRIGKIIRPVEEAINLAVHAELVVSTIIFQPYQKAIDVGTPMIIEDNSALSFQYSENDCKFS